MQVAVAEGAIGVVVGEPPRAATPVFARPIKSVVAIVAVVLETAAAAVGLLTAACASVLAGVATKPAPAFVQIEPSAVVASGEIGAVCPLGTPSLTPLNATRPALVTLALGVTRLTQTALVRAVVV